MCKAHSSCIKQSGITGDLYVVVFHNAYGDGSAHDEVAVRLHLWLRYVSSIAFLTLRSMMGIIRQINWFIFCMRVNLRHFIG